jgi:hypothetical protein
VNLIDQIGNNSAGHNRSPTEIIGSGFSGDADPSPVHDILLYNQFKGNYLQNLQSTKNSSSNNLKSKDPGGFKKEI